MRWTLPEDVGEKQPLRFGEQGLFFFDGRLDNREDLLAKLGRASESESSRISDARIAMASFERWGKESFSLLLGSWVLVAVDPQESSLVCARDPVGKRPAFYFDSTREIVVASDPAALLAHPSASEELDFETLSAFFALREPDPEASIFECIRQIPPGGCLEIRGGRPRVVRWWNPDWSEPLRYRSDEEYEEHLLEILRSSVRCRMRSPGRSAVLMSGGLDSTSVAALAAEELVRCGSKDRMVATSWVFDELEEADEREFVLPMVERYGLQWLPIESDHAWPLKTPSTTARVGAFPLPRNFVEPLELSLDAVAQVGCDVLLTGEFSDQLHTGRAWWMKDLAREGKWSEILRCLATQLRQEGDRFEIPLKRAVLRLFGDPFRAQRGGGVPLWLTDEAAGALPRTAPAIHASRPEQVEAVLPSLLTLFSPVEASLGASRGVELRHPFRDLRLIEFFLRAPAHQLFRPGAKKRILSRTMSGFLPKKVKDRTWTSSLLPLFQRGVLERELQFVVAVLEDASRDYHRWVRDDWLRDVLERGREDSNNGTHWVILWFCLVFEIWRRGNRELLLGSANE